MMAFLMAALFTLCLCLPLPDLFLRQSGATPTIFGRYSTVYALVLMGYVGYILLWFSVLALRSRPKGFYHFILGQLWRLLILQVLTATIFLVLSFILAIWRLPIFSIAATLSAVIIGPIAWLWIAPHNVQMRWWREGWLVWGAIGFSLGLIEILFRLLIPYGVTPDPIWLDYGEATPWRLYTGWSWRNNGFFFASSPDEFLMPIRINSHGLRDREYTYEKAEGVYRILIVGDSVTYAQEVPLEQTWHELLESRLNQSDGRTVEIIAAGVGGWSTDQELLYLRHEGCRYQPDLIILQFTLNDPIGNTSSNLPKPYFTISPDGQLALERFPYALESAPYEGQLLVNHLIIRSRALMALWSIIQNLAARYSASDVVRPITVTSDFVIEENDALWRERVWPLTAQLIAEFQRQATACGAQMASFLAPPPEWFSADIATEEQTIIHVLVNAYEETLSALNIPHPPTLWLLEPYQAHLANSGSVWDLTWRRAAHYTALGYELMADRLYEWLSRAELLPIQ